MIAKETDIYKLHAKGDAQYLTFKRLDEFPELTHVFTTRRGGISTGCCENWNLGFNERDSAENRWHNYGVLADVMGTTVDHMVWTNQTHTTNIKVVDESHRGIGITKEESFHDIDGLVTCARNVAIITTHGAGDHDGNGILANTVFYTEGRKIHQLYFHTCNGRIYFRNRMYHYSDADT